MEPGPKKFMDESQPQPMPENPPPSATTLTARLTNVFVSPSDVFDEVKAGPPTNANWIAPLVITMIVQIIFVMVIFSQPAVLQTIKDAKDKKAEEIQQMVAKGKMTQQQADSAREWADRLTTPTLLRVFGILGTVIGNSLDLFLTAGVLWLVGRSAFHAHFDYMKGVEVAGLALMITVLGAIIHMLLIVIYGNMSMTASPALLLNHFDQTNKVHLILAALNVFTLWYVAILSVGLARLSGTSFFKAAALLYSLWAILTLGPIWLFAGK